MKQPTRTINRLHFSDLDPLRFEDLCLNLVSRLNNWKELNHFGRKGSDGGVDIHAIKEVDDFDKTWFIQCKRYAEIKKSDLKEIVDKAVGNPTLPDKLLAIISCDISRTLLEFFKEYSFENGIKESEIWTASVLESKLYHENKDLLFVYFGLKFENRTKDNASRIKQTLRMEKRVLKELLDHKFIKDPANSKLLMYDPSGKFISSKVYIRSIDDTTYPNADSRENKGISPWFVTFFYDTYHNGLEFWLDAGIGTTVIMDETGYWEPLYSYSDKRKNNPKYKVIKAKEIGRIPYYNIIEFKINGDEYSSEPHLFCKFDIDGSPYEEIYYKTLGDPQKEIPDWEFNKDKRTLFPKD